MSHLPRLGRLPSLNRTNASNNNTGEQQRDRQPNFDANASNSPQRLNQAQQQYVPPQLAQPARFQTENQAALSLQLEPPVTRQQIHDSSNYNPPFTFAQQQTHQANETTPSTSMMWRQDRQQTPQERLTTQPANTAAPTPPINKYQSVSTPQLTGLSPGIELQSQVPSTAGQSTPSNAAAQPIGVQLSNDQRSRKEEVNSEAKPASGIGERLGRLARRLSRDPQGVDSSTATSAGTPEVAAGVTDSASAAQAGAAVIAAAQPNAATPAATEELDQAALAQMPKLRAIRTNATLGYDKEQDAVIHENPAFSTEAAAESAAQAAGNAGPASPTQQGFLSDSLPGSMPGSPDLLGTAGHLYMFNEDTGLLVNTGKGTGDMAARERKRFVEMRNTGKFVRVSEKTNTWPFFQHTERRRQAWMHLRPQHQHSRPTLEVLLTSLCDTFSMLGMFCQGVLGGLATLTLFMVYLRVPVIGGVDKLGDFLMYYSALALPLNRTYYALITVSLIAACSRHAAAQERRFQPNVAQLRNLGWSSILVYFIAYVCTIVCTPLDDELTYSYKRVPNFWRLSPFSSRFHTQMNAWHALNFVRILACLAGWLMLCYQIRPGSLQKLAHHLAHTKLDELQHQMELSAQHQGNHSLLGGMGSMPASVLGDTGSRMIPPAADSPMVRSSSVGGWNSTLKSVASVARDQDSQKLTRKTTLDRRTPS